MPKEKESVKSFLERMVKENEGQFSTDGQVLFCLMCDKNVPATQISQVKQHLCSSKHSKSVTRKTDTKQPQKNQLLLPAMKKDDVVDRNANMFAMDLTQSIKKAQDAIKVPNLKTQLAFIKSNFSCIVSSITKLQKNGMQLEESLEIVEAVGEKLKQMRGRPEFFKKYEQVATKNKGLAKLRLISNILELGKSTNPDEYVDSLTPEEIDAFKYAPITSSDVERSFSKYKNVLSDNRRSFLFDNLAKHVIIYCNKLD